MAKKITLENLSRFLYNCKQIFRLRSTPIGTADLAPNIQASLERADAASDLNAVAAGISDKVKAELLPLIYAGL